jgi:hypothetical protein
MNTVTVNPFNFTTREVSNIEYLASEHKLEVKVYKQNNLYSLHVLEKFYCAYHDPLSLVLAENVKTKKEAMQTANNFINWLDDQKGDIYNNGYNVSAIYVSLDK